jgi:histidinol-phosphate aminotransferase
VVAFVDDRIDIRGPSGETSVWTQNKRTDLTRRSETFIFFDAGRPHYAVATMLAARGIEIGRSQPPLDTWIRISIGLPEDNSVARRAIENLLR